MAANDSFSFINANSNHVSKLSSLLASVGTLRAKSPNKKQMKSNYSTSVAVKSVAKDLKIISEGKMKKSASQPLVPLNLEVSQFSKLSEFTEVENDLQHFEEIDNDYGNENNLNLGSTSLSNWYKNSKKSQYTNSFNLEKKLVQSESNTSLLEISEESVISYSSFKETMFPNNIFINSVPNIEVPSAVFGLSLLNSNAMTSKSNNNQLEKFLSILYDAKCFDAKLLNFAVPKGEERKSRFEGIIQSRSSNETLCLNNFQLGPLSISEICKYLFENPTYKELQLSGNNLLDDGCYVLAAFIVLSSSIANNPLKDFDQSTMIKLVPFSTHLTNLAQFNSLTKLILSNCNFGNFGASFIFDALGSAPHCSITLLDLSCVEKGRISIGRRGGASLQRFLRQNKSVTSLFLQNCNLNDAVEALARGLSSNSTIVSLDLSCNLFGNREIGILSPSFKAMKELRELVLSYNRIGNPGIVSLALSLPEIKLHRLDLSHNLITSLGFSVLTESLSKAYWKRFNILKLDNNPLSSKSSSGEEGLLAHALIANVAKDELSSTQVSRRLSFPQYLLLNPSNKISLPYFLKAGLSVSPTFHLTTLSNISFDKCILGDTLAIELFASLKGSKLAHLSLSKNDLKCKSCSALGQFIESCVTLVSLDLSNNHIADEGVSSICLALKNSKIIQKLNLKFNVCGDAGAKDVLILLSNHSTLTRCDIDGNRVSYALFTNIGNLLKRNDKSVHDNQINVLGAEISSLKHQLENAKRKENICISNVKELEELKITYNTLITSEDQWIQEQVELYEIDAQKLRSTVLARFDVQEKESDLMRNLQIDKATWASKISFLQHRIETEVSSSKNLQEILDNDKNKLRQCTNETDMFISSCYNELKSDATVIIELQDALKKEQSKIEELIIMMEEKNNFQVMNDLATSNIIDVKNENYNVLNS